jgi:cytochrome c oxidase subunit II
MRNNFIFIVVATSLFFGCRSAHNSGSLREEDIKKGETLFRNLGCIACHSVSGEKKYGPALNSILGQEVEVIRQGKTVILTVDRDYILRSVKEPGYEKVSGFKKQTMPVPSISPDDLDFIVDYIVSVNRKDKKK